MKLSVWLGLAGICVLFVVLRWHRYDAPLIRDEGEYAYAATLLRQGIAPYEHSFVQKPPMVIYSYALAGALAPGTFWAPRILSYLFAAGATVLLGFIARLEFGAGVALPTMWLFTPMVLLPGLDQSIGNTEMFMLLPLLATFGVYAASRHHGGGSGAWFAAGCFAALTIWFKYTALPLLAALWAFWSYEDWRRGISLARLSLCWVMGLLGAVGVSIAVVGYFLVRDGGTHLWECTVAFNRAYAASSTFGLSRLWVRLLGFWGDWWILFLLPWAVFTKPIGRAWFWSGIFLAAWLATGASYYRQYYVLVMPFWALLSAVGLKHLVAPISSKLALKEARVSQILTGLVVSVLCLSDLSTALPGSQQLALERFDPLNPFPESRLVAKRVAELSSPEEPVFVAGSEPQILYYAHRISPTRFVIAYPMMLPTPLAQRYQQEAIRDLERTPPSVIVRACGNPSWLRQPNTPPDFLSYLDRLLADKYERVGGYVLGNETGQWVEPIPDADLRNASLVVFRRKG